MFSYSDILRKSYAITSRYRVLWVFGLLVVGGFNLNFFQFQNVPARDMVAHVHVRELLVYYQAHPAALASTSFSILVFSLLSLFATNWSRIMLALLVQAILKTQRPELMEQMAASKRPLRQVVGVSLFTTTLVVIIAAALFIPPFFVQDPELQTMLWSSGVVLFLPMAFAISCINIFTAFFIVLYRQPFGKAVNQGTDFFVTKWTEILGMCLLLLIVYIFCFFVGLSIISVLQNLFRLILEGSEGFHILSGSAIIWIPRLISGLAVWMLLAILNVFINTALLLLFLELVKPAESGDARIQVAQPAPAATV